MARICLRFCSFIERLKGMSTLVSQTFTKPILLLLLWNFALKISYSAFWSPSHLHREVGAIGTIAIAALLSIANILSPLAGYLGDMKYSRFGVLKCGAYFIVASSLTGLLFLLIVFIVTLNPPHTLKLLYFSIFIWCYVSLYMMGYLLLSVNFIQFSTDQLRDAPTNCTVLLLYAVLWSDNFSQTLNISNYVNGNNKTFNIESHQRISYSSIYGSFVILVLTLLLMVITMVIFKWKQTLLLKEKIKGNPYKLVVEVLLFALRHKSPLRRSAFTFCENEPPSRIDFGKTRYGGPYSTEHVENVKVLLNILKVLASVGPVFLLDYAASLLSIAYVGSSHNSTILYVSLLEVGPNILSSVIIIFALPIYVFMLKPSLERCAPRLLPNFFKKIGLSMLILTLFFVTNVLYDGLAYNADSEYRSIFRDCVYNETFILNQSIVYIPNRYRIILQAILLATSHVLLNVSLWEFICSQSPQNMKGLLFGLLFALRAFMDFLAVVMLVPFVFYWKISVVSCSDGYNTVNILIGLITLILFTVTARKYKYRKRDDICNVYQFAEDYYSK